jgi:hypothetical protein
MIIFLFSLAFSNENIDFCAPFSEEECKTEKFCEPVYSRMPGKEYGLEMQALGQFSHCQSKSKKKVQKFKIKSH